MTMKHTFWAAWAAIVNLVGRVHVWWRKWHLGESAPAVPTEPKPEAPPEPEPEKPPEPEPKPLSEPEPEKPPEPEPETPPEPKPEAPPEPHEKKQLPKLGVIRKARRKHQKRRGRRKYTALSGKKPTIVKRTTDGQAGKGQTNAEQRRDLHILVHLAIVKQDTCKISLLPERQEGMPECIDIIGTGDPPQLQKLQDDFYEDVIVLAMDDVLANGAFWEPRDEPSHNTSWSLPGRPVYVLELSTDIGWYVSIPRLIVDEKHAVICTTAILDQVKSVLAQAGANDYQLFDSASGTPEGWVALVGVCPTSGIQLTPQSDIFNVLRPDADATIHLRGGIRLGRSSWLIGSPPKVMLGGLSTANVFIDGEAVPKQANGSFETQSYADEGLHMVTLDSSNKTVSYEIVKPSCEWELFAIPSGHEEYNISNAIDQSTGPCGPAVVSRRRGKDLCQTQFMPVPGGYLAIGQKAGEIVTTISNTEVNMPCSLCPSLFQPVWLLPANPYKKDKITTRVTLVGDIFSKPYLDLRAEPNMHERNGVLNWAKAILDCSRKRLPIFPDNPEVIALWEAYRNTAKLARRRLKC